VNKSPQATIAQSGARPEDFGIMHVCETTIETHEELESAASPLRNK
jgi:hypothetical protein